MRPRRPTLGVVLVMWLASCGGAASQLARESVEKEQASTGGRAAGEQAPATEQGRATENGAAVLPSGEALEQRAGALTRQGIALLKTGDLDRGIGILEQAVDTGRAGPEAFYNLAVALLRKGDAEGARRFAFKAADVSGGAAKALNLYYSLMEQAGLASDLRARLGELVARHPDSLAAANALARVHILVGKPAKALRRASELLKKDETNIDVMKTIAHAYLAMQRYEGAKLILNQILETRKDPQVLDLLGQIAMREKRGREAIAYFEKALALDPNLADAYNNMGVLYLEAGDYEGAADNFRKAVELLPGYKEAYMNLGNAYRKMLRFKEAEAAYRQALKLDPDCADCYFNLGVAALENRGVDKDEPDHYRKAMEYFSKYKETRRGPPRHDDPVDKYMDEARRMADYLEKQSQMQEVEEEDDGLEESGGTDELGGGAEEGTGGEDEQWVE